MDDPKLIEIFMDIQRGLPRQGPGNDNATCHALSFCTDLPEHPSVLDIGCGPGAHSIILANQLRGSIIAIDLHQEYLDELKQRAAASGLGDYVTPMLEDMTNLPFAHENFHLIWSEGAAYIMGVENALREWRKLIKPRGYIVFSELLWLTDNPPDEAKEFFDHEYPAMRNIEYNKELIKQSGYRLIQNFTIEENAWWNNYYSPLEAKLPALRAKYINNEQALSFINVTATEIEIRRKFGSAYGYEFFVAQLAI